VAPDGRILWTIDHISWYETAKIIPGDPGYFYLGYSYSGAVYAQKMDIQGHTYWPSPGSLLGAVMMDYPTNWGVEWRNFSYLTPYFYGVCNFIWTEMGGGLLQVQLMDSRGERKFRDGGITLTYIRGIQIMTEKYVVPDGEGGLTSVWRLTTNDVYAKHMNPDGTLGGPMYTPTSLKPPAVTPQIQGKYSDGIEYTLPQPGEVEIELFDLLGRRVAVIFQGYQHAGSHTARFNLEELTSGIYLLRLKAPGGQATAKIIILR